jgi:glycerate 2-kinase
MTGCGGGLSGGLWAAFGAELVAGANLVLDAIGLDDLLAGAQLVITGEGRIDSQTSQGKLVAAVAGRCSAAGVPCVTVVGQDALGADGASQLGLARVVEAGSPETLRSFGQQLGATLRGTSAGVEL